MFKLRKFNIDFDVTQKTPYFQVDTKHQIRFGMKKILI